MAIDQSLENGEIQRHSPLICLDAFSETISCADHPIRRAGEGPWCAGFTLGKDFLPMIAV
jgi:hypothetical protein